MSRERSRRDRDRSRDRDRDRSRDRGRGRDRDREKEKPRGGFDDAGPPLAATTPAVAVDMSTLAVASGAAAAGASTPGYSQGDPRAGPLKYPPGLKSGRVKAWFDDQGFGFVMQDDGSEDLFVHRSALTDGNMLVMGAPVLYDTVWNEQKQKMMAATLTGASSPMQAGTAAGMPAATPMAAAAAMAVAPAGKKSGRVKAWFEDQGFGFILQDDGGEDLFVHRSALTDGNLLLVNAPVAYQTVWNERKGKMLAANLTGAMSPLQAGIATGGGTTAVAAAVEGKKSGRVKAWIEDKGFGFILQDDGGEDLFVHRSAVTDGGSLVIGATVLYEEVWNDRKQKNLASHVMGGVPQGKGGKGDGKGEGGGGVGGSVDRLNNAALASSNLNQMPNVDLSGGLGLSNADASAAAASLLGSLFSMQQAQQAQQNHYPRQEDLQLAQQLEAAAMAVEGLGGYGLGGYGTAPGAMDSLGNLANLGGLGGGHLGGVGFDPPPPAPSLPSAYDSGSMVGGNLGGFAGSAVGHIGGASLGGFDGVGLGGGGLGGGGFGGGGYGVASFGGVGGLGAGSLDGGGYGRAPAADAGNHDRYDPYGEASFWGMANPPQALEQAVNPDLLAQAAAQAAALQGQTMLRLQG